ncbi:MAG: hypothetical protein M1376_03710 [Planctomycetes bacterium]|nr:hypothetical protein [Planctomycetota bacterium]
MTAKSGLKWLLRFIALTAVFAFVPAVMPQSWLVYWANKVAPGTTVGILFTYLARMLMAMYAFVGLLCFIMSTDIRRYLPLIWVLSTGSVVGSMVGLIALFAGVLPDQRTGFFWVVFGDFAEGLAQGVLLLLLLLRLARRPDNG